MGFELGAVVVGGISILTIIVTKLKCYAKKNGSCNYGCGFLDRPLIDDEYEVKTLDLGGVNVMYSIAKHHHPHHEEETDIDETD